MKKATFIVTMLVVVPLLFGTAFAESQSSAKATAKAADLAIVSVAQSQVEGDWQLVLSNAIKTSNWADLNVDVSMECGLYTSTDVRSKGGVKDTSLASGSVQVMVVVDPDAEGGGIVADPGDVVFCRRDQTLSATLQGQIINFAETCFITDEVTGIVTIDESCLAYEEIELILDTVNANSFNFLVSDLTPGVHTVAVYAKIDLNTTEMNGSAEAKGLIGKGSMSVEEVRFIKDEDVMDLP